MRERMFLIAYHKDIASSVQFPSPSHWIELPSGYDGSRAVALKLLADVDGKSPSAHYCPPPVAKRPLPPAITTSEAIGDLPPIDARKLLASGELTRGARRFDKPVSSSPPEKSSEFSARMRSWPGFEASGFLGDHVIRYLPRDYALFARLKPGDQYPEAFACAEKMFEEKLRSLKAQGEAPRKNSPAWKSLRASIVPPYDPGKFPNKWRKMESDQPSRTLLAHLGKDGYSHIHYDSRQARTISVREAARLQSFPERSSFFLAP